MNTSPEPITMTSSSSSTPSPIPSTLLPLILPYLTSTIRTSFQLVTYIPKLVPWSSLISPLSYVFAPLTTFISILLTITVFTPYHLITWLLENVYPVYVFCGVACITGGILGLSGRLVSLSIIRAVNEDGGDINEAESKPLVDAEVLERSAKRRRLGKKERDGRVKFEPS